MEKEFEELPQEYGTDSLPHPMTRGEILDFLQQRREQSQWYDEKNPIEAKDLEEKQLDEG